LIGDKVAVGGKFKKFKVALAFAVEDGLGGEEFLVLLAEFLFDSAEFLRDGVDLKLGSGLSLDREIGDLGAPHFQTARKRLQAFGEGFI